VVVFDSVVFFFFSYYGCSISIGTVVLDSFMQCRVLCCLFV
jgi:hypothetical protein